MLHPLPSRFAGELTSQKGAEGRVRAVAGPAALAGTQVAENPPRSRLNRHEVQFRNSLRDLARPIRFPLQLQSRGGADGLEFRRALDRRSRFGVAPEFRSPTWTLLHVCHLDGGWDEAPFGPRAPRDRSLASPRFRGTSARSSLRSFTRFDAGPRPSRRAPSRRPRVSRRCRCRAQVRRRRGVNDPLCLSIRLLRGAQLHDWQLHPSPDGGGFTTAHS